MKIAGVIFMLCGICGLEQHPEYRQCECEPTIYASDYAADRIDSKSYAQKHREDMAEYILICHGLWLEVHSQERPTPEQFRDWCNRVPSTGCNCNQWLARYIADNPVDYEKFPAYAVRMHNAVNAKLNKKQWPHYDHN